MLFAISTSGCKTTSIYQVSVNAQELILEISEMHNKLIFINNQILRFIKILSELLKENQHRLLEISYIGFIKADTRQLKMGIKMVTREIKTINYILSSAEDDGHCYLTTKLDDTKANTIYQRSHQVVNNAKVYEAVTRSHELQIDRRQRK